MCDNSEYEDTVKGPGKFERESRYSPYYYEQYLDGGDNPIYGADDTYYSTFDITDNDKARFPELAEYAHIVLWEDGNGFVYCEPMTESEFAQWLADIEDDGEDESGED